MQSWMLNTGKTGDEGVREQFLHYCPCPISPNLCLSHHHWCYRHHHIADAWRMLPHHSHHRCCHNLIAAAAAAATAAAAAAPATATAPAAFTATFNNQTFMIFFPVGESRLYWYDCLTYHSNHSWQHLYKGWSVLQEYVRTLWHVVIRYSVIRYSVLGIWWFHYSVFGSEYFF